MWKGVYIPCMPARCESAVGIAEDSIFSCQHVFITRSAPFYLNFQQFGNKFGGGVDQSRCPWWIERWVPSSAFQENGCPARGGPRVTSSTKQRINCLQQTPSKFIEECAKRLHFIMEWSFVTVQEGLSLRNQSSDWWCTCILIVCIIYSSKSIVALLIGNINSFS